MPQEEGLDLISGRIQQFFVVPDGPLALLPLETLIVADDESPRYLLDAGPPIIYGPSATVLCNLAERPAAAASEVQPVLTVANPTYGASSEALASNTPPGDLTPRARYRSGGGALGPLPYTASESKWVAESFKSEGIPVARLDRALATELELARQCQRPSDSAPCLPRAGRSTARQLLRRTGPHAGREGHDAADRRRLLDTDGDLRAGPQPL